MAEIQTVEFVDDWDGKPVDGDEVQKARFVVEGVEYKLDLRPANYQRFLKDMKKWSDKAQKIGRVKSKANKPSTTAGRNGRKAELAAIREWANANGYEVSHRGKIPLEVHDAYERAQ